MKVTFEKSPYGDEGKTYCNKLGMIEHFILQLKSYREQDKTQEQRGYGKWNLILCFCL